MVLQVHDELLFEVKESVRADVTKKIINIMENVVTLRVPVVVDAKHGKNWLKMQ
jgi:DNA polymerase I